MRADGSCYALSVVEHSSTASRLIVTTEFGQGYNTTLSLVCPKVYDGMLAGTPSRRQLPAFDTQMHSGLAHKCHNHCNVINLATLH